MKLNYDCIRDILLTVESNSFGYRMTLDSLSEKLSEYSTEELHYCCLKLYEGNYLELITVNELRSHIPGIKSIFDLTYDGHEFLETIKSDTNWNKTKRIALDVGSSSLSTIKDIATQVITSLIISKI